MDNGNNRRENDKEPCVIEMIKQAQIVSSIESQHRFILLSPFFSL